MSDQHEQDIAELRTRFRGDLLLVCEELASRSIADLRRREEAEFDARAANASLQAVERERDELRQRDRVLSNQLDKRAGGRDALTQSLQARAEAAESALTALRSRIGEVEKEMRAVNAVLKQSGHVQNLALAHYADRLAVLLDLPVLQRQDNKRSERK